MNFTWVVIVEELRILWTLQARDAFTFFYNNASNNMNALSAVSVSNPAALHHDGCEDEYHEREDSGSESETPGKRMVHATSIESFVTSEATSPVGGLGPPIDLTKVFLKNSSAMGMQRVRK